MLTKEDLIAHLTQHGFYWLNDGDNISGHYKFNSDGTYTSNN